MNILQLVGFGLSRLDQGFLYRRTVFLEYQSGVVAQLAKVLQGLENVLLLLLVLRLDGLLRLLLLAVRKVVVEVFLDFRELAIVVLDYLRRQVVEHVFLESTEQEGENLLVERFESKGSYVPSLDGAVPESSTQRKLTRFTVLRFSVSIRKDRFAEAFVEGGFRAQEPRHQEIEQTPQFQNVILNWGP